jgi:membrane protease YdiL (CAAX protease family)
MSVRDDFLPNLTTKNLILIFVGTLSMVFVTVMCFALLNDGGGRNLNARIPEATLYVAQDYTYVILIFLGIYLLGIKLAKLSWSDVGFRRCSTDWIARAFLLGTMIYGIRILADSSFTDWFGLGRVQEPGLTDHAILQEASPNTVVAFVLVVCFLTPFVTEVFQRGILFAWLRRNFNFMLSAIASALIFGALHIELVRFAQVLVFGIAAAYLYEHSRSIWPSLAFHLTINGAYVIGLMGR